MPAMGVYDQIKRAFQDIVAPEIHSLRGEIHRLDGRTTALDAKVDGGIAALSAKLDGVDARLTAKIDGLDGKIVSMKGELLAEIRRVDTRIDAVHTRIDSVNTRFDSLERDMHLVIDIRERLAALEARRS